MSAGSRLRTVVADTSALVSLAVPRADGGWEGGDPLQYLLTSCTLLVPPEVVSELKDVAQYRDIHAVAAGNALAARDHYAVRDPYELPDAPDSRPAFGLDDGETDGVVLANAEGVDGLLTDEFGGTNFALVHAALRGPRIVPTPRLVCDYAHNGYLAHDDARALVERIGRHRSWEDSPYVAQLLSGLE
ncbi:hypothetical protein [Halosimplex amylolyticum]|uniref:hypothetical protein n=1 Tax=Halosimplex amylolyticum TaxID=3396616 RepID=UPI003F551FAA